METAVLVSSGIGRLNNFIKLSALNTIPMYQKFIEQNSSFSRKITQKGKVLYERHNKTMA